MKNIVLTIQHQSNPRIKHEFVKESYFELLKTLQYMEYIPEFYDDESQSYHELHYYFDIPEEQEIAYEQEIDCDLLASQLSDEQLKRLIESCFKEHYDLNFSEQYEYRGFYDTKYYHYSTNVYDPKLFETDEQAITYFKENFIDEDNENNFKLEVTKYIDTQYKIIYTLGTYEIK